MKKIYLIIIYYCHVCFLSAQDIPSGQLVKSVGLLTSDSLSSQRSSSKISKDSLTSKWHFAPNFGVSAEKGFSLHLLPSLSYRFHPSFNIGLGASLQYAQSPETATPIRYGLLSFLRWQHRPKFPYLQTEYEGLVNSSKVSDENKTSAKNLTGIWRLGLGYCWNISRSKALNITFLRNITWSSGAVVPSPWEIRMGMQMDLLFKDHSLKELSNNPVDLVTKELIALINQRRSIGKRITISPQFSFAYADYSAFKLALFINYQLHKQWVIGLAPVLQKSQDNEGGQNYLHYGGKSFVRFRPVKRYPYLHGEYELLYNPSPDSVSSERWNHGAYLGIGYTLPLKHLTSIDLSVFRNILWRGSSSVHPSPWELRVGVGIPLGEQIKDAASFNLANLLGMEGNIGFSLGDYTQVIISPVFTHQLKGNILLGAGPSYQYSRDNKDGKSTSIFGGRVYGRYKAGRLPFYGQIEMESMNSQGGLLTIEDKRRRWNTVLAAGGGMSLAMGRAERSPRLTITLLRILNWAGRTPVHNDPWIARLGIQF